MWGSWISSWPDLDSPIIQILSPFVSYKEIHISHPFLMKSDFSVESVSVDTVVVPPCKSILGGYSNIQNYKIFTKPEMKAEMTSLTLWLGLPHYQRALLFSSLLGLLSGITLVGSTVNSAISDGKFELILVSFSFFLFLFYFFFFFLISRTCLNRPWRK